MYQDGELDRVMDRETLRSLLDYDPETGVLTWKVNRGKGKAGATAGHIGTEPNGRKFIRIEINTKPYFAHRLAWLWMHGDWPKNEIDHINGDPLDNRISNLRDVTHRENGKNRKMSANNTSGRMGVHYDNRHKKWCAMGSDKDGKRIQLYGGPSRARAIFWRKVYELEHEYHENHGRR